ncbi:hypothetical protein RHMOL_Rhmol01G0062900 [Rhododendron molle]|uniref:Uncharacterized protein n=1 Tax=Rhododendron molle TaxID=49168 RepID=A0ACC0Q1W3_RHOML|nr:hypothetical protein RHMOL_Rhmol01G0062900 [Rhododendron molle]
MDPLGFLFQFLLYFLQYQVSASPSSPLASSAHPLCRHDQRSALLRFKHMLTINSNASLGCGVSAKPKTNSWNKEGNATDCCSWDGVTCDALTGHVIGLDLSCSQLYGTIHPYSSLFQLSHLQRLNLAWNSFIPAYIPPSFGNLTSLTHLNLSASFGVGLLFPIPFEISHLSKLTSLDLSLLYLRIEPLNFKILLKNLTQLQELVLVGLRISSGLPDSMANLTSLTALDLSWTELQGNLPESVFHLPNLQRLLLRGNIDLDINLPKSIWRSGSSLRELDLSSTNLSGELPDSIGHLKSLNSLIISNCKLRGSIPKSLANLIQIRKVDLSVNDLNGEVPYTFSNLKQLTELYLSSNKLKGRFPLWVANSKQLVALDISYNQLEGPIPSNLSGLQNLRSLGLSSNSFSGVIPPWLFTLPSLEVVGLSSNRLTGQIPKFQHHLPLDSIYLSDNKLHGPIPKSFSTLVNLTRLFLASNDLSGVVDLQILKNVEVLDLSNTNLSVVARSHVNNTLPNLRYFKMSSCNIEAFPHFLRASENLEVLDLSQNRIHGQVPNWVGFFGKASLEYLNLSHNFLTNMQQLPWEGLKALDLRSNLLHGPLPIPPPLIQYFFISNNSLNGEIPSLICNARSLEIVDLSHNKLSGAVPQCMGNFSSVLSVLNLRSNGLTGTLPLAFAKPNYLRSLDLSGNQLEGPLPRSLADCTSLEVLNVGNNRINDTFPNWLETLPQLQLTGRIPSQLTSLTFLAFLNLSWNRLHGPIPRGQQFNTFENVSYVGNSGLCGLPLSKECEDNNRTKVQPAVLEQEEDDSAIDAFFWKIVVIGYGCGMTLGLFLGSLMFLIGRPKFFVRLAEREMPKKVIRLRRMVTDTMARRK